eukprot:517324-Pyramimonas_sp.AAC.1
MFKAGKEGLLGGLAEEPAARLGAALAECLTAPAAGRRWRPARRAPQGGGASPGPPSCAAGPAAASLSGIVLSLLPASVTGLLSPLGQDWKKPDKPGSQMARSEATWKLSDLELGATVGVGSFGRVRVAT